MLSSAITALFPLAPSRGLEAKLTFHPDEDVSPPGASFMS